MKNYTWIFCLGLILVSQLPAHAQGRATIQNQGFEEPSILRGAQEGDLPEPWFYFASTPNTKSGVTDRKKRSGIQSFLFKGQKENGAYTGIAQIFDAEPGFRYEFTVYAINDSSDPISGETYGQVSIEWKNDTGEEMSREFGPSWNYDLSPIRWQKFLVGSLAPEGASSGQAVVTFFSRDASGLGTCYIDDAKLTKKNIVHY